MKLGMPILYEYNSLIDNVVLAKTLGYDFIDMFIWNIRELINIS